MYWCQNLAPTAYTVCRIMSILTDEFLAPQNTYLTIHSLRFPTEAYIPPLQMFPQQKETKDTENFQTAFASFSSQSCHLSSIKELVT